MEIPAKEQLIWILIQHIIACFVSIAVTQFVLILTGQKYKRTFNIFILFSGLFGILFFTSIFFKENLFFYISKNLIKTKSFYNYFFVIHLLITIFFYFLVLIRNKKTKNLFENKIKFFFLFGFTSMVLFGLLDLFTTVFIDLRFNVFDIPSYGILGILLFSISSIIIFLKRLHLLIHLTKTKITEKKQHKSMAQIITQEESKKIINKIHDIMNTEKLYKNPELNIKNVAERLSIPRCYLSYIINNYSGINFCDFINNYRIKEVKEYLRKTNYKSKNLLTVALEAGFNSKTTFNRVFKKLTKMTPSMYHEK